MFCPPTDELFLGVKDEGATLNGSPIHVSEEAVTRNAYLHMSFCHRSKENNARVIRLLPEICQSFSDLRRSGWRGAGPVPWSHEPNRGFLRALYALGRAAAAIGESEEVTRIRTFLDDSDPTAAAAIEQG